MQVVRWKKPSKIMPEKSGRCMLVVLCPDLALELLK